MLRVIAAACLILSLSASVRAGEVCVACDKPAARYRCTFEQATRDAKFQLGDTAQRFVCEQVLAKSGPHETCRIALDAQPCDGAAKTVTLADLQKVMADGEGSTYQPGVFEIARRNVNATWVCVTSLFNDC
jgi:hypothetical protein